MENPESQIETVEHHRKRGRPSKLGLNLDKKKFKRNWPKRKQGRPVGSKNVNCKDDSYRAYLKWKSNQPSTCDYCGIVKPSRFTLRNHIESHLNFKCDACGQHLQNTITMKTHLLNHILSRQCETCGLTFFSMYKWNAHQATHDPGLKKRKIRGPGGLFACSICPRTFNAEKRRDKHQTDAHKDGRTDNQYKCKFCPRSFYLREDCRVHFFDHFPEKARVCPFEGCNKSFKSAKLLSRHKQIHGPPKYKCENCDLQFHQRPALYKHLKRGCNDIKAAKAAAVQVAKLDGLKEIAEKAKIQYEQLYGQSKESRSEDINTERKINVAENSFADSESDRSMCEYSGCMQDETDEEMKPDIKPEVVIKDEAQLNFNYVAIKDEPKDWNDVFIEESISSRNECVTDFQPKLGAAFVLLHRLKQEEITDWTSIKTEPTLIEVNPDIVKIEEDSNPAGFDSFSDHERDFDCWFQNETEESFKNPKSDKKIRQKRAAPRPFLPQRIKFKKGVKLICDYCGEVLISKCRLRNHFEEHRRQLRTETCRIEGCNRVFRLKRDLTRHYKEDHGVKMPKRFQCDYCGSRFRVRAEILSHFKTGTRKCSKRIEGEMVKKITIRNHICDVCGKAFLSAVSLKAHMDTHSELTACPQCGKMVRAMEAHLRTHTRKRLPELVECSTCGLRLWKASLREHIEKVHFKKFIGKRYDCESCAARYTRREDLRRHTLENHFNGKIHRCNNCDQIFPRKKFLTRHQLTHNQKSYKCKICGKAYNQNGGLIKHTRKVHPEISLNRHPITGFFGEDLNS